MKEKITITLDNENIEKHMENLKICGLNRSEYFNKIIIDDNMKLNQILNNEELTFNEAREKIKIHFRAKIGEGE